MKKQDWLTSCAVALVVALVIVIAGPQMGVADSAVQIPVPALPSTSMMIPTINAEVTATATPVPGKRVIVNVALKSPSGAGRILVPVTITISRTESSPMMRSVPLPVQVAQVSAMVPVGVDGNGMASVALPLIWEIPAPVVPQGTSIDGQARIRQNQNSFKSTFVYQMALSSNSLGIKAAPAIINRARIIPRPHRTVLQLRSGPVIVDLPR
ncbi:MAG: hypothetical protein WCJ56_12525 [bacterium]